MSPLNRSRTRPLPLARDSKLPDPPAADSDPIPSLPEPRSTRRWREAAGARAVPGSYIRAVMRPAAADRRQGGQPGYRPAALRPGVDCRVGAVEWAGRFPAGGRLGKRPGRRLGCPGDEAARRRPEGRRPPPEQARAAAPPRGGCGGCGRGGAADREGEGPEQRPARRGGRGRVPGGGAPAGGGRKERGGRAGGGAAARPAAAPPRRRAATSRSAPRRAGRSRPWPRRPEEGGRSGEGGREQEICRCLC